MRPVVVAFLSYSIISFIAILVAFLSLLSISTGSARFPMVPLSLLPALLLATLFVVLLRRFGSSAQTLFLLLAIPSAFAFALFILPDQIPDEIWHIFRVLNFWKSGNGDMLAPTALTYGEMPTTYAALANCLSQPADWRNLYTVTRDMSSYLSHLYLIPGLAAGMGQLLDLNPFVVIYMARLANALLFLFAGFWIISIMPFGKTPTAIYLLNPVMIQQAASCSADAMVNIITLLFIAVVIRYLRKEHLNRRDICIIAGLAFLVCISKYAYAPLLLLLFGFLPRAKKRAVRIAIPVTFFVLSLAAIWFVLIFYRQGTFEATVELMRTPGTCASVLINTVFIAGPFWVETFAGQALGILTINPWVPAFWAYCIVLLMSPICNNDDDETNLSSMEKWISALIVIISIGMITLALRDWSMSVDKNYDYISGVQGRYFIPFLLLPILGLVRKDGSARRSHTNEVYALAMAFIFLLDVFAIIAKFN